MGYGKKGNRRMYNVPLMKINWTTKIEIENNTDFTPILKKM